MFLKIEYDTLADVSRLLIDTVKRSVIDNTQKNVVFKVEPSGSVSMLALTDIVVVKSEVPSTSVALTEFTGDNPVYFQVSAVTLEKLISTYAVNPLTTPLSVTFHPLTDVEVSLVIQESLKLPDKEEDLRNSSLRVKVPPFYATDLYRLEFIEVEGKEGVEFTEITEKQREIMSQILGDLTPYVPTTNNVRDDMLFNSDKGTIEFFHQYHMPIAKNPMDFFIKEGGIRPSGVVALKDLLADGIFKFYKDEDKNFYVIKQGMTTLGFVYDKEVNYPPNPTEGVEDLPWISFSRPLIEMYLKRINSLSALVSGEHLQVVISEDKSSATFKLGDLELTAPIDTVHESSIPENNVEFGGFHFNLAPSLLPYLLFGDGDYADDIRFAFIVRGKFSFLQASDSSKVWSVLVSCQ